MTTSERTIQEHSKRRVTYFYDNEIANYHYGATHVMKPQRIRMAHHLIFNYNLNRDMEVIRPFPATCLQMAAFHDLDYLSFLASYKRPDDKKKRRYKKRKRRLIASYGIDDDCPLFPDVYDFSALSSGGSIGAASKLASGKADIAINWMGGLHHAKKGESSGFCYTNDIVLGILELLKVHKRVLYVDIDVHHGDGVEEAFYTTDRVMTVSFHKYAREFFPYTGRLTELGVGKGFGYSLNVPLMDGITDDSYQSIFTPIMTKVMERYQPGAVVLQCGADSLCYDKLGPFNLTIKGHGACVSFFRAYNIPLLLLGGGGYTPRNVARCWTYETALATGRQISNELPWNDFYSRYKDPFLFFECNPYVTDNNTKTWRRGVVNGICERLNDWVAVPSVQMQPLRKPLFNFEEAGKIIKEQSNPDVRKPYEISDSMIEHLAEYYDASSSSGSFPSSNKPRRNESSAKSCEVAMAVSTLEEPMDEDMPCSSSSSYSRDDSKFKNPQDYNILTSASPSRHDAYLKKSGASSTSLKVRDPKDSDLPSSSTSTRSARPSRDLSLAERRDVASTSKVERRSKSKGDIPIGPCPSAPPRNYAKMKIIEAAVVHLIATHRAKKKDSVLSPSVESTSSRKDSVNNVGIAGSVAMKRPYDSSSVLTPRNESTNGNRNGATAGAKEKKDIASSSTPQATSGNALSAKDDDIEILFSKVATPKENADVPSSSSSASLPPTRNEAAEKLIEVASAECAVKPPTVSIDGFSTTSAMPLSLAITRTETYGKKKSKLEAITTRIKQIASPFDYCPRPWQEAPPEIDPFLEPPPKPRKLTRAEIQKKIDDEIEQIKRDYPEPPKIDYGDEEETKPKRKKKAEPKEPKPPKKQPPVNGKNGKIAAAKAAIAKATAKPSTSKAATSKASTSKASVAAKPSTSKAADPKTAKAAPAKASTSKPAETKPTVKPAILRATATTSRMTAPVTAKQPAPTPSTATTTRATVQAPATVPTKTPAILARSTAAAVLTRATAPVTAAQVATRSTAPATPLLTTRATAPAPSLLQTRATAPAATRATAFAAPILATRPIVAVATRATGGAAPILSPRPIIPTSPLLTTRATAPVVAQVTTRSTAPVATRATAIASSMVAPRTTPNPILMPRAIAPTTTRNPILMPRAVAPVSSRATAVSTPMLSPRATVPTSQVVTTRATAPVVAQVTTRSTAPLGTRATAPVVAQVTTRSTAPVGTRATASTSQTVTTRATAPVVAQVTTRSTAPATSVTAAEPTAPPAKKGRPRKN